MSEKYWEHVVFSFLIVATITSIAWVVNGALQRRWHARRTYDTYVLGDGIVNSVTVTLDVRFKEAERRRILSEYGKVLSTYAPAFDPIRHPVRDRCPKCAKALTPHDYARTTNAGRAQDPTGPRRPANRARTPGVPDALRQRAETLLRYYPEAADIVIAHDNCPHWFGPAEQ